MHSISSCIIYNWRRLCSSNGAPPDDDDDDDDVSISKITFIILIVFKIKCAFARSIKITYLLVDVDVLSLGVVL